MNAKETANGNLHNKIKVGSLFRSPSQSKRIKVRYQVSGNVVPAWSNLVCRNNSSRLSKVVVLELINHLIINETWLCFINIYDVFLT